MKPLIPLFSLVLLLAPCVALADPSAEAQQDIARAMDAALTEHYNFFEECLVGALEEGLDPKGKVEVEIGLRESKVVRVEVKSDQAGLEPLSECYEEAYAFPNYAFSNAYEATVSFEIAADLSSGAFGPSPKIEIAIVDRPIRQAEVHPFSKLEDCAEGDTDCIATSAEVVLALTNSAEPAALFDEAPEDGISTTADVIDLVEIEPLSEKKSGLLAHPKCHVEGALSQEEVEKTMQKHHSKILQCFRRELDDLPGLSGEVVITFEVTSAGLPNDIKIVKDTLSDTDIGSCIVRRVARARFAAPEQGIAQVRYPFVFESKD